MRTDIARSFRGAESPWPFVRSRPLLRTTLNRWRVLGTRVEPPAWSVISEAKPRGQWIVYFIHAPRGTLTAAHRFTLERLSLEDAGLLVVCACPADGAVLDEVRLQCDALIWKDLPGWDFSAYAIGLEQIARQSPGANVLLMNDSVLGPFRRLTPFMQEPPWRLTGFTANAGNENHIQSYALVFSQVDPGLLRALSGVLSTEWAYNSASSVILWQETRLARAACRHMTVGAWWYTDTKVIGDLCLHAPAQLIEAGFPFLKRSLIGKFADVFQRQSEIRQLLSNLGHPPMPEAD